MDVSTVTPYSPSQTATWLTCPILRHLGRSWKSRRLGRREIGGLLGSGFAEGVAVYNRAWRAGLDVPTRETIVHAGMTYVERELTALLNAGHYIGEPDAPLRDNLVPRLQRALETYMAHDPIPESWQRTHVEYEMPSRARIDLGVRAPHPAVVDYKLRLTLDNRYRAQAVEEWRTSWQLYHYVWEYGLGTPGRWPGVLGEPVRDYYILLGVVEPRPRFELLPFIVQPEALARWEQSAWRVWEQMAKEDRGEADPWQAAVHRDQYGPCPMHAACFDYFYDDALMDKAYVRRA